MRENEECLSHLEQKESDSFLSVTYLLSYTRTRSYLSKFEDIK